MNENPLTDVLDGEMVTVSFRDPSTMPLTLKVRRIPIFDMEGLSKAWGKVKQEAALYVARDDAFVSSLTDESFSVVFEKGRQLNFISYQKWFGWQQETLKALGQGMDSEGLVSKVVASLKEKGLTVA